MPPVTGSWSGLPPTPPVPSWSAKFEREGGSSSPFASSKNSTPDMRTPNPAGDGGSTGEPSPHLGQKRPGTKAAKDADQASQRRMRAAGLNRRLPPGKKALTFAEESGWRSAALPNQTQKGGAADPSCAARGQGGKRGPGRRVMGGTRLRAPVFSLLCPLTAMASSHG